MAHIEVAPVDTFVPEARLDDNDGRKLIAFYKEKPILWDMSLNLSKKAAKEQKETALKDLGALWFQLHIRRASRSMEKSLATSPNILFFKTVHQKKDL